jgi:MFS family permease
MTPAPANLFRELNRRQQFLILAAAFLGWMFGGVQMAVTSLAMRSAAIDLLGMSDERLILKWFAWYTCAFLLGAAVGVLPTGSLQQFFAGDYARVGQFTSLVFLVGAVVIWAAPDTSVRHLQDEASR